MLTFEWIIGLLLVAVVLSALARRIKIPYPIFLAVGGALLAFAPQTPSWTLEPDLALALFVAPVLLDAAFDTSLRDLRNNWLPVTMLVVVAVGVTMVASRSLALAQAEADNISLKNAYAERSPTGNYRLSLLLLLANLQITEQPRGWIGNLFANPTAIHAETVSRHRAGVVMMETSKEGLARDLPAQDPFPPLTPA